MQGAEIEYLGGKPHNRLARRTRYNTAEALGLPKRYYTTTRKFKRKKKNGKTVWRTKKNRK